MLTIILEVFAFVLFCLATYGIPSRWNLIAAGLAFYMAAILFGGVHLALR
jgi:Na+/H+-dicarboxylate symporter